MLAFLIVGLATPQSTVAQGSRAGQIRLLAADENGVTVEAIPPPLEQIPLQIDGRPYAQLQMAGYGLFAEPGKPAIPQHGLRIALPPGAVPVVDITAADSELHAGIRVSPAEQVELVSYDAGDPLAVPEFTRHYPVETAVYGNDNPFPEGPVQLGPISWLRDQRVVTLYIRPVQAFPSWEQVRVYHYLRIRLTFTYPDGPSPSLPARPESPVYEAFLRNHIVNYNQGRAWRTEPPTIDLPPPSPCLGNDAFRISVTTTGMHRLTQSSLAAAGFPASADIDGIQMCHRDEVIAIEVEDSNGDNQFNNGDAVVFYGEAIKTQETETNIYWLTHAGGNGLRMDSESAPPDDGLTPEDYAFTVHLERDDEYQPLFPSLPADEADYNDHWYFQRFADNVAGVASTLSISFDLPNKATESYPVAVEAELWGFTAPQHHPYEVLLNGFSVGSGTFYGSARDARDVEHFQGTIDSSYLQEGSNTITLRALNGPDSSHTMFADWIKVTPRRQFVAQNDRITFEQASAGSWLYSVSNFSGAPVAVYDVTDPDRPIRITGATSTDNGTIRFQREDAPGNAYALTTGEAMLAPADILKDTPSNLRSTSNRADYLIITDPSLSDALDPLRSLRASQGLVVKTVFVQDIFDEFNYGLYDAGAIRTFLAYAYHNWQSPAPSYVLLVGEGSYDHRNVLGLNGSGNNLVPVYLRSGVDSNWGETVADNQYVSFLGDDDLADMMLGRLPALNSSELTTMVAKIVRYETAVDIGWRSYHYFLTDNYGHGEAINPATGLPYCIVDNAGNFHHTVDNFLRRHFPDNQFLRRTDYAPQLPYEVCYPERHFFYVDSALETTSQFIQNMNRGSQFVVYTGHSAIEAWAHEQFVTIDTAMLLTNADRTPIMLPMTCLEGLYHRPGKSSVAEALLKATGGGSVASYSPSGLQVQQGHDYLLTGFYSAVYDGDVKTLGEAVLGAKAYLAAQTTSFQDLQDTFMLLGDPALQLNMIRYDSRQRLPIVGRP